MGARCINGPPSSGSTLLFRRMSDIRPRGQQLIKAQISTKRPRVQYNQLGEMSAIVWWTGLMYTFLKIVRKCLFVFLFICVLLCMYVCF